MNNTLKFFKCRDVKSPQVGTPGSAGIDFFVPNDFQTTTLQPGEDVNIGLGIKTEFEEGLALIAHNKSGIATKKKLITGACVVDSDYRGEIHAHLFNAGTTAVTIEPGMKILQFILMPYIKPELIETTEELSETERGEGGFGSTGMQ